MKEQILDQLNLYVWAKNTKGRYIFCNENYAMAAGLDSPNQIVGKTDDQMPWRHLADFIKAGDYGVLQGNSRVNAVEITDTLNNVKDILVSESKFYKNSGECIGVAGSFVDITGKHLVKKTGHYDSLTDRYYLGAEDFDNTYLTGREISIFKRILLGDTAQQTAHILKISPKTVESYVDNIKLKLQTKSRGEIIATAIQFGLTHILYLKTKNMPC